jgi:hypothetical protein
MRSKTGDVLRLLLLDLGGSVAWFPLWWYTTGVSRVAKGALQTLRYRAQSYSLGIWVRNFFVPMYGQHDLAGRLVSILMRFVVLVGRSIALAVEAVFHALWIVLWLVAPAAFIVLAVNGLLRGGFTAGVSNALP